MNKAIITLLIFTLFSADAIAQQYRWGQPIHDDDDEKCSIALNLGAISSDFVFAGNTADMFGGAKYNYWNTQYSGILSLTFQYMLGSRFSLGFTAAYERIAGGWLPGGGRVPFGKFKRQLFSFGPEAAFTYRSVRNGAVHIYALAGIAGTYSNEVDAYYADYYNSHFSNGVNTLGSGREMDNNKLHFNGQLTPLGLRFGRKLCAHLEVGFGYKGAVNLGMIYKF